MVTLASETLIGVSYGLLVGLPSAVGVGLFALTLETGFDRRLPPVAGVVATVPALLAGLAVGILEPAAGLAHAPRIALFATVAGLLGVFATSLGVRVGTDLPRDRTHPLVRGPALAPAAIDAVDAAGQVTIRPTGPVRSFDGYPPLPPSLRDTLEDGAWRFPADLQLAELERRLARRLRTEYDLPRVDATVDARGRATITVAPPANDLAGALPDGMRAVPVTGLVPAGVEPGDAVAVGTASGTVTGIVLTSPTRGRTDVPTDSSWDHSTLTVAVETPAAGTLLESDGHHLAVLPDGTNPVLEAVSLLERTGRRVTSVDPATDDGVESATVLGYRSGDRWVFPRSSGDGDRLGDGDDGIEEAFVVDGSREVSS